MAAATPSSSYLKLPRRPGDGGAVDDVEVLAAEALAQDHDLAQILVLVDVIGLGEVPEGFVDEDAGEYGVEDDGVFAALGGGRGEEVDGALGLGAHLVVPSLDNGIIAVAADAEAGLLHVAPVAGHRPHVERHVDLALLDIRAVRSGEDDVAHAVAVGDGRAMDGAGGRPDDLVVLVEQRLLVGEGDAARVFHQARGDGLVDGRRGGERRSLVAGDAGLPDGESDLLGEVVVGVERDEAPAAVDEGAGAASLAPRAVGLFEVLAAVLETGGLGVFEPELDVFGVVALERLSNDIPHRGAPFIERSSATDARPSAGGSIAQSVFGAWAWRAPRGGGGRLRPW